MTTLNATYPHCSSLYFSTPVFLRQERVLFQTHPLPRLLSGNYSNGGVTMDRLLKHGDFGLGTFNDFHGGEMVVLGAVYSLPMPNEVHDVSEETIETPFAMVTSFQRDQSVFLRDVPNYQTFQEELQRCVIFNPTKHYAIMLQGRLNNLSVQCVQEPHASNVPFSRVEQQRAGVCGANAILIGFRMASSVDSQINKPGFHLHGMTEDFSLGGHVLDFGIEQAVISVMEIDRLALENH